MKNILIKKNNEKHHGTFLFNKSFFEVKNILLTEKK